MNKGFRKLRLPTAGGERDDGRKLGEEGHVTSTACVPWAAEGPDREAALSLVISQHSADRPRSAVPLTRTIE